MINPFPLRRFTRTLLFSLLLALPALATPEQWAADIGKFTAADAANPPPAGAVVFVGSSSIRFWTTLAEDFPGIAVLNRGFGGSELADSAFYADRIVIPYHPRLVVLYAGENDLANGKTPETVAADFNAFCAKLHAALPATPLIYIAMKPSPSRWALHDKFARGNALIAAACARDPRLAFVNVEPPMLGPDGQPRPELFREDRLHMKPEGYALWTKILTPYLKP